MKLLRFFLVHVLTIPAYPLGFLWKCYSASFNSGQSAARVVLGKFLSK